MDLPFVWDAPRPYVHPLTTPAGAVLSVEAPADHPWHHALWFTIKFVNGENFWEEYGEFGLLRTTGVDDGADGSTATLDWIAPDGESVRLRETRTVHATVIDDETYAIDWSEELHARAAEPRKLILLPGGHHRSAQHDAEIHGIALRWMDRNLA